MLFAARVTKASSASREPYGKSSGKTVLVVENLDVEGHGIGLAADVAGDHRHSAKLTHGPRVTQDHSV